MKIYISKIISKFGDFDLSSVLDTCAERDIVNLKHYTPIAFDERVTFWVQRAGSLPCACVFAALYACEIA